MKIRITTLAFIVTTVAFSSMNPVQAGGCGGRGGFSIGIGGGGFNVGHGGVHNGGMFGNVGGILSHQHNSQPVYHTPSYPQHAPHMMYPQHGHQPSFPQPVYSQQRYPQGVPAQQGTNIGQMSTIQTNGVQGNVMQAGSMQATNVQNMNPNMQPSQNAIAQAPQNPSNIATQQNVASQPRINAQQLPANTVAPTQGTPSAQSESSALQLLASMNGDAANSAIAELEVASSIETVASIGELQPTGAHVGTWRVVLPGNQTIALVLSADNNFQWSAVKDGKASSFQGQYMMDAGRLTLVRSTDLQQMAGSWNGNGANFTFKLDGATSSGLAFARSE